MTRKGIIVKQIKDYFISKGRVLSAAEYKEADDVPIRYMALRRSVGSWARLENMIGKLDFEVPELLEVIEVPVVPKTANEILAQLKSDTSQKRTK